MIAKKRKPLKPIKRTLVHRMMQLEQRQDDQTRARDLMLGKIAELANQNQVVNNFATVHERIDKLQKQFTAAVAEVGKELRERPKVADFGSAEWRASNPGKIIDYWPTKRDLWALRARVPNLSSNELVKALTQMLDRWAEMHG